MSKMDNEPKYNVSEMLFAQLQQLRKESEKNDGVPNRICLISHAMSALAHTMVEINQAYL
jgi:hypothetical protein